MAVKTTETPGILDMHGKRYLTVALRVALFREKHPALDGWGIAPEILVCEKGLIRVRAVVTDPSGRVVAVGHAQLTGGKADGDKALEKTETTAVGRALAAAGIIGDEYASADEIADFFGRGDVAEPPAKRFPAAIDDTPRARTTPTPPARGCTPEDVVSVHGEERRDAVAAFLADTVPDWSRREPASLAILRDRIAAPAGRAKLDEWCEAHPPGAR